MKTAFRTVSAVTLCLVPVFAGEPPGQTGPKENPAGPSGTRPPAETRIQAGSPSPDSHGKGEEKQYRDIEYSGWKIPFVQASEDRLVLNSDLFELDVSKKDGHLNGAEIQLSNTKLEWVKNPIKDAAVGAWAITKFTRYYDLNGDSEFDLMIKYNDNRPPGSTAPVAVKEYILFNNRFIEIHPQRTKPRYRSEFTDLAGHIYKMTPGGWMSAD